MSSSLMTGSGLELPETTSGHMRINMKDTNIKPVLSHPRMCMNGSPTKVQGCQSMVKSMREVQRQQRRNRDLQEKLNHNPNSGNITVLVLLVIFVGHENRNLTSKSYIEGIWNGEIKEWFNVNAREHYQINPYVVDWTKTDNSESFYAGGEMGIRPEVAKAMWPILDQLDNQEGWDWSKFDSDGDGKLDSIVMMHSGVNALASVEGDKDCFGQEMKNRIWPHAYTNTGQDNLWRSKDQAYRTGGYTVASVFENGCDDAPTTTGLTCHEYMHTMDLIVSANTHSFKNIASCFFSQPHTFTFHVLPSPRICTTVKTSQLQKVSRVAG